MRLSLFAAPLLALAISACGTPTVEYQVSRCQTALDNLDVLAAKQQHLSQEIHRKKVEFATEFEKVKGLQGEEGSKTIGAVCYRIEQYHTQLAPPAPTTTPGGKLGATPGQPGQPVQPGQTPPPGGKLGGAPGQPAAPGAPTPAPDSGFGGAPAPGAPTPTPTPDSGFGGGAPAPGAPTPAPAPQGGGFGGQ